MNGSEVTSKTKDSTSIPLLEQLKKNTTMTLHSFIPNIISQTIEVQ